MRTPVAPLSRRAIAEMEYLWGCIGQQEYWDIAYPDRQMPSPDWEPPFPPSEGDDDERK